MTDSALFDVQSVLRILFREASSIERETLERIIAFDMEWLDPFQSEQMVEALLATGWISIDEGWCKLKVQLPEEELPLGWFPRPQHLLHPAAPQGVAQQRNVEPQQHEAPIAYVQSEDNSDDGGLRSHQTKRLKSYLSRSSGLSVQEIERRAERKVHALQYTTQWMALALIAKEVGLPMNDIIDVFQS
jgi:hypothetical protein